MDLHYFINFMYSEKATKFCEISTLDLTVLHLEISQNLVAFSEYINFINPWKKCSYLRLSGRVVFEVVEVKEDSALVEF